MWTYLYKPLQPPPYHIECIFTPHCTKRWLFLKACREARRTRLLILLTVFRTSFFTLPWLPTRLTRSFIQSCGRSMQDVTGLWKQDIVAWEKKTNRQYVDYKMHTGEKLRLIACSVGNVTWSEDSSVSPFSAFSVSSSARSGVAMATVEGEGRERSAIARARELTQQCPRSQTRCWVFWREIE